MKKTFYLVICLLFVFICVGCENKENNSSNEENNNQEVAQEEVKDTKVSCSGPMVNNMFASMKDIITDDKMEIYAIYDNDENIKGIYYVYELTFGMSFEGSSLDALKAGLEKVCDNKQFSDCNVTAESKYAKIEAELDSTQIKAAGNYTKEKFKKEISVLGTDWTCTEE